MFVIRNSTFAVSRHNRKLAGKMKKFEIQIKPLPWDSLTEEMKKSLEYEYNLCYKI